jgi:glycosyltransferase involved in cell wall biosynthesis
MSHKLISIVSAAFNEEENVRLFYEAVRGVAEGGLQAYDVEVVIVDDGSTDKTFERLRELAGADPRVRVLRLSRNFGHQAALTAGLREAKGAAVVTLDCDLQDPPGVIADMVRAWEGGDQVVYGRRALRVDTQFKKTTADLYYRLLEKTSEVSIPRNVGDFRLLDRAVLQSLTPLEEHARYLRGLVAWLGFRHGFVEFERAGRERGVTHYSLGRMAGLAMDGLLNFTLFPLRLGLWIGVMTILVAVVLLVYMMCDAVINHQVYPLFKWLSVLMFAYLGAMFMFMWVLGEYIGRIYQDVRRRPLYVVSDRINC